MKDMKSDGMKGKMTGDTTGVAKCSLGDGSKIDKIPYGDKDNPGHKKKY